MAGRKAELRVGAEVAENDVALRVGSPLLPEVSGWERLVSAQFTFDGQDSPVVPSKGTFARARYRRFLETSAAVGPEAVVARIENPGQFDQAEVEATTFFSPSRRDRLFGRLAGGTSFDAHPYFNDFSLGGPFRMSAFRNDELRGAHYGLASAGYLRQLPRPPAWVGGHAYLAAWVEVGSAFDARDTAVWHTDISAGVVVDSLIGPVFAGGSAGPHGHHRLYVAIGPLFR
jgi:NTE family protein